MEEISVSFMDPMTVDLSLFNDWLNGVSGIFLLFAWFMFIGGWGCPVKKFTKFTLVGWVVLGEMPEFHVEGWNSHIEQSWL